MQKSADSIYLVLSYLSAIISNFLLNIITCVLSDAIYFVVSIRLSMALNWGFMNHDASSRKYLLVLVLHGQNIYLSPTLSLFLRTLKLRIIPDCLHSNCTCKV